MTKRMPSDAPNGEKVQFDESIVRRIASSIAEFVPHNRALGIRIVDLGKYTTLELPWNEKLIGNPEKRVVHGGAITSLMDATCGTSVIFALAEPVPVATLDLRIDYLKPGQPEKNIHARAHCFKAGRSVAFVRCEAFHPDDPEDLIAVANGTFMIFRGKSGRRRIPK